jgi:hypothetical protein
MWGYEFAIRIAENNNGFGSTGTATQGLYLDADSESLAINIEYEEGANKLKGDRAITYSDFVKRNSNPGGGITYQPRSDNIWQLLMANMQAVDVDVSNAAGTLLGGTRFIGTLTFAPIKNSTIDWVGSTWGTVVANVGTGGDIYCVQAMKLYGGAKTYATNALIFDNCIVDNLRFGFTYGEDIIVEPTFKAYTARAATLAAAYFNPPGAHGSFSTKQRYADWNATLSISGSTYDIQSLTMNLGNQTTERGRVGLFGNARFPFGKTLHEGEMTLEFSDPTAFPINGTGTILVTIYGGTNDWIKMYQYNAVWRSHEPQASSGDAIVEETIPYRAVMDSGKSVAETIIQVCCDINNAGVLGTLIQEE